MNVVCVIVHNYISSFFNKINLYIWFSFEWMRWPSTKFGESSEFVNTICTNFIYIDRKMKLLFIIIFYQFFLDITQLYQNLTGKLAQIWSKRARSWTSIWVLICPSPLLQAHATSWNLAKKPLIYVTGLIQFVIHPKTMLKKSSRKITGKLTQ